MNTPLPAIVRRPIHGLFSNDSTRLERDEEHINKLAGDFERRLREHPDEHPVLNPLRIFENGEIIAGTYRFLAGLRASLVDLPCIIEKGNLDDIGSFILKFRDNALHHAYTPVEEAHAICRVMTESKVSQTEAGRTLGISGPVTTKRLAVLNKYPADLHHLIGDGQFPDGSYKVPFTSAYTFTHLHPDEAKIRELTDKTVKGLLTRDAAIDIVNEILRGKKQPKAKPIKVRLPGFVAVITVAESAALCTLLARLDAALKQAQKLNLPLSCLPQLLR